MMCVGERSGQVCGVPKEYQQSRSRTPRRDVVTGLDWFYFTSNILIYGRVGQIYIHSCGMFERCERESNWEDSNFSTHGALQSYS